MDTRGQIHAIPDAKTEAELVERVGALTRIPPWEIESVQTMNIPGRLAWLNNRAHNASDPKTSNDENRAQRNAKKRERRERRGK